MTSDLWVWGVRDGGATLQLSNAGRWEVMVVKLSCCHAVPELSHKSLEQWHLEYSQDQSWEKETRF